MTSRVGLKRRLARSHPRFAGPLLPAHAAGFCRYAQQTFSSIQTGLKSFGSPGARVRE